MPEIRVSTEGEPSAADLAFVREALGDHNVRMTGISDYWDVSFVLRDSSGRLRGALLGDTWGSWLHITFLWIEESLRRQGWGRKLMEAAEADARSVKCLGAFLDTFNFQARPFYERFGYEVFGEVEDYPAPRRLCQLLHEEAIRLEHDAEPAIAAGRLPPFQVYGIHP